MARYYLWTLRRRFTAQYLLAWQRSVGVFSFFSLRDCQKTNLLIYITIYGTIRAKNWQLF